jgi:hypothetical protein
VGLFPVGQWPRVLKVHRVWCERIMRQIQLLRVKEGVLNRLGS